MSVVQTSSIEDWQAELAFGSGEKSMLFKSFTSFIWSAAIAYDCGVWNHKKTK